MSKTSGARCFVSQEMYEDRNHNFLKGLNYTFFNKEHYKPINLAFPSDVQKAILPESGGKITRTVLKMKIANNAFWSQAEKGH